MAGNCTLFIEDQHYCKIIAIVKQTVASFSLVASLFIIFVIWLFRKYKYFVQRLILALTSAACLDSISYLLTGVPPDDNTLCDFQAWLLSFTSFSVLLWVCCITFNLYWNAIKEVKTDKFEKYYHLVSWGIPFVVACLPLINDHYGPAGAWCWISKQSDNSVAWRFATYYIPVYLCIIGLFVVYSYIFITIRRQIKRWEGTYNAEADRSKELMKQDIRPLMWYPVVYLLTTICPLIDRIQNAASPQPNFILLLLQVLSSPLVGMLNAIVFGMDKETLSRLNCIQMKVALIQHTAAKKPLVREYPVGETNEVRPNDDSSWSSATSTESPYPPSPTPVAAPPPPLDEQVAT
ncbi:cyclic AMP receptor-like protein A [Pocillopora damicornis]|uniref:cyclic AMP receptor-like protein A n=1 Tax=Pocillopora damicornis TaxID=46731 RepID=UPI000F552A76|nr:cyclic AMP receptor-like protein A [Pocillopora damicornis]